MHRSAAPAVVSHYNAQAAFDIYGNVQGTDLGVVAREFKRIVDEAKKDLPKGSSIAVTGQIETMQQSFNGLLIGLIAAIILVYMLIVVNFQSLLDPLIIITALPAALAGIVWMLFLTGTTLSVPALTGAIMCMGVATANSVLVVSFARAQMTEGKDAKEAALAAGFTRLRPVIITATRNDHRHDPHGARARGERRAERAAGSRGHRGPDIRHRGDALFRPDRVYSWCMAARRKALMADEPVETRGSGAQAHALKKVRR